MTLAELKAAKKAALEKAKALYAPYGDNAVVPGEVTGSVKTLIDEARDLDAKIKDVEAQAKSDADQRSELRDMGRGILDDLTSTTKTDSGLIVPKNGDTLGGLFADSAQYQAFMKSYPTSSNARNGYRVNVDPVQVKTLVTGLSSTSAGAFIETQRLSGLDKLVRKPLVMRDLVTKVSIATDTIEYVVETSNTNNAAFVPEATSSAAPTQNSTTGPLINNAGGGYKPEGGMAYEIKTDTVKTLAEWLPVTRQALADAGLMRGLINTKLVDDLDEVEDNEILNGAGGSTHFQGILTTSGVLTYNTPAEELLAADFGKGLSWSEGIRRAKTQLRTTSGVRARANAVVMNPADVDEIWLARQAKNPGLDVSGGDGSLTVAGLPIVESDNIAIGDGLIGDFSEAFLYDREQTTVYATDSHLDFFIRNLIAVLAEKRVGFGVHKPAAFLKLDLDAIATPAP